MQAMRCCALPGFDTDTWTATQMVRIHMGRPRDYSREGKDDRKRQHEEGDWTAPIERAEAGCPGSWYRTAFVESLLRYYRRRDRNGGRIENPHFTRCEDDLVIEAIRVLEHYEDTAEAEAEAAQIRAARAARKD